MSTLKQFSSTLTMTLVAFSVVGSLLHSSQVSAAEKKSSRAKECAAALKPMTEEQRLQLLAKLVDTGVVLGAFHLQAVIQVGGGSAAKIYSTKNGANDIEHARKPFRDLSKILASETFADRELRRSFAERVVTNLRNEIFVKDQTTVHSSLMGKLGNFYFGGLTKPSLKQANLAWQAFDEAVQTPEGRELLVTAIQNSNSKMLMVAYGGQQTKLTKWAYGAVVLGTGPAYSFITGGSWGLGTEVLGVLASFIPAMALMTNIKPIAAAQMRLNKVIQNRRLKKLIVQDLPQSSEKNDVKLETLSEQDLNLVFDREMVKAQAKDVKKISPTLKSGEFSDVALFGGDLVEKLDQASDFIGLMSQRMNLLEADVLRISGSVGDNGLKLTIDTVTALSDRALDNSGEILQDAEQLQDYLSVLEKKVSDHISMGQAELDRGQISETGAVEMKDILEELRNGQSNLDQAEKILPVTIQVVKGQRAILRGLRSSLLGQRLSQPEKIAKLSEAIAKLNKMRISDSAGKSSK